MYKDLSVVVVGGALLFVVFGFVVPALRTTPVQEPIYCTEDAKICPDGSYVGRIPPKCEFAACPEHRYNPEPSVPKLEIPVACPADAKLCPDGSAVGRGGPRCEFPKCPGE